MNIDDANMQQNKYGCCKGVLRNDKGSFLGMTRHCTGEYSVIKVELWGILNELQMAQDAGVRKPVVKVDYGWAVTLGRKEVQNLHPLFSMIFRI